MGNFLTHGNEQRSDELDGNFVDRISVNLLLVRPERRRGIAERLDGDLNGRRAGRVCFQSNHFRGHDELRSENGGDRRRMEPNRAAHCERDYQCRNPHIRFQYQRLRVQGMSLSGRKCRNDYE
jgi:hypothetical protein